jgi:hypothetical protein
MLPPTVALKCEPALSEGRLAGAGGSPWGVKDLMVVEWRSDERGLS